MPGAPTIEDLLSQVGAYQKGAEAATQQVVDALGKQVQLTGDISDLFTQKATDDTTVAAAKNAADYQTQLARVKAANVLGTNLKSTTEQVSALAAEAQDAYQRKDQALKSIQDKQSISFLDHPLDWVTAQFTINDDIAAHNIANHQLQSAQDRLQAINSLTQQTVITQNAINEPLTAAAVEASTRSAATESLVQAKNAQIAGLNYNTKGIEFALNAKKDVLSLAFQVNNAQNAEKQIQMSLEHLNLAKQEFKFRQDEYQQRMDDKEEQKALGQSVLDTINLGRKAILGADSAPLDDISGKMAIAALKGKGTLSAELQKYYDAGERTRLTGKSSFGATPAQAAETLQSVPAQLNPTQGPIKNILSQAVSDTGQALKDAEMPGKNKNPVFQGIDKKSKDSINMAMNGRAQQILDTYAAQINPGDSSNPYQIGSINQLAAHSPTIQALPVYQKVLKPIVDSGVQLTDPKQIVSLVGQAVAKGTITHQEAVDLATVYHVGVTANMAMRNFTGFGLVPRYSYNAQIETDTGFHSTETIDLTKPDVLSRALLKMQASRMRTTAWDGFGPVN